MIDSEIIKMLREEYKFNLIQLDFDSLENTRESGYALENGLVTGLSFIEMDLREIPIVTFGLRNLRKFVLFGNKLEYLSEGFLNFECLESIFLGKNRFNIFPFVVTRLINLKRLHIGANYIETIPKEISNLIHLEELSLTNNQLDIIPDSFYNLSELRNINLSYNKLDYLPNSFEKLHKLKSLDLRRNRFNHFPNLLLSLFNLSTVRLEYNEITEFSSRILDSDLKVRWSSRSGENGFIFEDNPLINPPIRLIKKGSDSLRTYFKSYNMDKPIPDIFVSYSHSDSDIVDFIDNSLKKIGIDLKRDVRDVKYRKSFTEFMHTVRKTDYVLMIVSNSFLKSRYCMFEVLEAMKDIEFKDRLLPIVVNDAKIYNELDKIKYIKYWKNELENIELELHDLELIEKGSSIQTLKKYKEIMMNIGEFINLVLDLNHIKFTDNITFSVNEILESINYFKNDSN
ncbi:MAG: TIR domain-containing protein [Bacteroidales bacterium]|nr:TIR domain-containing protein [Bacteroidales bacterium]